MEAFLASVICFAGNFAPRGWATCDGQIMAISQNTALFSLLGTMYGGDGKTTFALPDLRGRVPIGVGQPPGMPFYSTGEAGGNQVVTLLTSNLPAHVHTGIMQVSLPCNGAYGTEMTPAGFYPAGVPEAYAAPAAAAVSMKEPLYSNVQMNPAGGGQPIPLMPPYQSLTYIIALSGVFPQRS